MNTKKRNLVMNYVNKQDLSSLHFVETNIWDKALEDQYEAGESIKRLKHMDSIKDRIYEIIILSSMYATFDNKNKFQCREGANRSTVDIWRIYNNYFRPISIFTVMHTLYELVVVENDVETLFCYDIQKQVFCDGGGSEFESAFVVNELGVRFAEWRDI